MTADLGQFFTSLLTAQDSTQAMQAAVRHVTRALSSDISWVGLIREDRQLHLGAHQGLNTPDMSVNWRLAVGEGIGGRAASLMRTQKSSNYLHDSRRVPAKRLIDNELIATVLVTPLVAADTAIGVLYAAHRQQREWTTEDIRELESAAHHLSVRLTQLEDVQRAEKAVESFRTQAEAAHTDLLSAIDLVKLLTTATEIDHAVDAIAMFLDVRVELLDQAGRLVCASGSVEAANESPTIDTELGSDGRLSVRLFCADEKMSLTDPNVRIALHAARLQLLRLSEREAIIEELSGDLQDRLLTGKFADSEHLRRRLSLIGCAQVGSEAQVVVIESRTRHDRLSQRFLADLQTTFPQSLVDHRDGITAVIVGGARSEQQLADQMKELLDREENRHQTKPTTTGTDRTRRVFVAGIGRHTNQLHEVSSSYDEARAACAVGLTDAQTDHSGVVSARALGLQGLASIPHLQLKTTVEDTFGPIISHDAIHGTDFLTTVRAYLANDRHIGNTAAELHVHYNTVRNRISRIEALLDLDFSHADDRYRAETAVRMAAVLSALTPPTTQVSRGAT